MKLYKEVLIESAEQAEELPEGAIFWTQRPHGYRYDYGTVGKGGVILASDWADEPDTLHALVPIEAAEERARSQINITHSPPPAPQMVPVRLPCPRCGLR